MSDTVSPTLDNLSEGGPPLPAVRRSSPRPANVDASVYAEADADRLAFWADKARRLTWAEPFTQVLDWSNAPFAKWFADGKLNVAVNCLDRHVEAGLGDRVAFHFEGEPGDTRTDHLPGADGGGLPGRERPRPTSACRRATGSRSTCR